MRFVYSRLAATFKMSKTQKPSIELRTTRQAEESGQSREFQLLADSPEAQETLDKQPAFYENPHRGGCAWYTVLNLFGRLQSSCSFYPKYWVYDPLPQPGSIFSVCDSRTQATAAARFKVELSLSFGRFLLTKYLIWCCAIYSKTWCVSLIPASTYPKKLASGLDRPRPTQGHLAHPPYSFEASTQLLPMNTPPQSRRQLLTILNSIFSNHDRSRTA